MRTNASCWRSCAHAADYLRPPSEPVVTSVAPAMFGACPVAASANDDDRLRRRFVAAANASVGVEGFGCVAGHRAGQHRAEVPTSPTRS